MHAARPAIASCENTSKGFDAPLLWDCAKSIRISTNVFKTTSFVSLYQTGKVLCEEVDKVLVMIEVRGLSFGPAKEARQSFIGLAFADIIVFCYLPLRNQ